MQTSGICGDLHMHTAASDGTVGIKKRVQLAKETGLDAIAITDHDTIAPELTSRQQTIERIEVITGVEVRADLMDTKIEILGYYVDPMDDDLLELLERVQKFRRDRNDKMMAKLTDVTGLGVSRNTVPSTEGAIGRPHIAKYLAENDVVPSIQAAFDEYLADDAKCFVPMERVPGHEVLERIQSAGGVASLAHPGRINTSKVSAEEIVSQLTEMGLDSIEVWYPYSDGASRYADIGVEDAAELANEHDLLQTGGSDCHGPDSGKFRLGDVGVPSESLANLRNQAQQNRPFSAV
jgi:predicted metal-dependent phosphoesterase TrpH